MKKQADSHPHAVAISAAAGYFSHITLDACTLSGVPLFWPSRWRFRLLPLRTGGIVEQLGALGQIGLLAAIYM